MRRGPNAEAGYLLGFRGDAMRYQGSLRTVGVVVGIAATSCGGDDNLAPGEAPDTGVDHVASNGNGGAQNNAGTPNNGGTPNNAGTPNNGGTQNTDAALPPPDADAGMKSEGAANVPCIPNDAALTAPTVPDNLKVPAGATLVARFFASGDQVYTCTDTTSDGGDAGAMYTWVLKAPDAKLYDPACMLVGAHYAGPTWWIAKDGSSVVGARLQSAPSPHAGAIPQLLLKAVSHDADGGPGVFSNVTFVQRLDTVDGSPPASCAAAEIGHDLRVAYTATYYFYTGGITDAGDAGSD